MILVSILNSEARSLSYAIESKSYKPSIIELIERDLKHIENIIFPIDYNPPNKKTVQVNDLIDCNIINKVLDWEIKIRNMNIKYNENISNIIGLKINTSELKDLEIIKERLNKDCSKLK